jgi:hypothetical protein
MPGMPGGPGFPAALRLYLELSDTQIDSISFLNADYQRFVQAKQWRMGQVQQELMDELAKDPLDPMAIGLRYAEMEATRRQFSAELARTRTKIRAVLTEPQAKKLKALEDITKLLPIFSEAVQVNLLGAATSFLMPISGGAVGSMVSVPGPRVNEP